MTVMMRHSGNVSVELRTTKMDPKESRSYAFNFLLTIQQTLYLKIESGSHEKSIMCIDYSMVPNSIYWKMNGVTIVMDVRVSNGECLRSIDYSH